MFLRTERLFLRPAWMEDAAELAHAIGHEAVVCMLSRVPWPYGEEHAREWISRPRDPALPDFLVTLPEAGGRIVGGCGLHLNDGQAEAGYWIEPEFWGRGYATEALRGVVSLAQAAGHRRLVSRHAADNPASGRVLRKVGFHPTGRRGTINSLGCNALLEAPEYALELGEADGPQDAPMPKAA
ncbi:MAG TPA: GNAT family N-acetyltransferase [Croceibacterium sp.]|nr:GNAT family N-acetyltransferase [Croceibacterium sp.]